MGEQPRGPLTHTPGKPVCYLLLAASQPASPSPLPGLPLKGGGHRHGSQASLNSNPLSSSSQLVCLEPEFPQI